MVSQTCDILRAIKDVDEVHPSAGNVRFLGWRALDAESPPVPTVTFICLKQILDCEEQVQK